MCNRTKWLQIAVKMASTNTTSAMRKCIADPVIVFVCVIQEKVETFKGLTTQYILPIGYSVLLPWIRTSLS